jgi:hypothetical protein
MTDALKDSDMSQAIHSLGQIHPTKKWRNRILLVQIKSNGVITWTIQVKLDLDPLYKYTMGMDVFEESRAFESREEASGCFQFLIPLKHVYPPIILRALKTY